MKRIKFAIGVLAILSTIVIIFFVLRSDQALVTNPKGTIAESELKLIGTNFLLMLIVVIPTFIFLFVTVWKYRIEKKNKSDPKHTAKVAHEVLMWTIPSVIVAIMAFITWKEAHRLDPYRPLESKVKPLIIQVVALDWKWLFIYPEQGIATLNFVEFPANTPIHFKLCADGSPMNSFWIPQLSGQIYSMTGMQTQLHIMANELGEYTGRAAEINGEGYADMTFLVKSTTDSDFENWIAKVKQSQKQLTYGVYTDLAMPFIDNSIVLYSTVPTGLFHLIIMKHASHPME